MKCICKILVLFCLFNFTLPDNSSAQCNADSSFIYGFNDPNGSGAYSGFLCGNIDSVGTIGVYGYYDGDGYSIKLVAGTQVVFFVDSCLGNVSLTVNDSSRAIIPGAFSGAACPNLLNFTATYTGTYILVMNLNGVCGNSGATLLGQAYAKIQTGTTIPACPDANLINDTICGAITLPMDSFVSGNTSLASPTDPLDGYVVSIGDTCSPPNNTLWYSFSSSVNIDTAYIWLTSDAGSNFHSWLIRFKANTQVNPCTGGLTFLGCINGPDGAGNDTVVTPFYNVVAGEIYYFMIDGFNGASGPYSLAIRTNPFITKISEHQNSFGLNVFPIPASDRIFIQSFIASEVDVSMVNTSGKIVYHNKFSDLISAELAISNLSSGIYSLMITSSDIRLIKRIIIAD